MSIADPWEGSPDPPVLSNLVRKGNSPTVPPISCIVMKGPGDTPPRILGKISPARPPGVKDGSGRVIIPPIDPVERHAGMGGQSAPDIGNRVGKEEMAQPRKRIRRGPLPGP
jgi:hypothetical protein